MTIYLFSKQVCSACQDVKSRLSNKHDVVIYDVDTLDGRVEACMLDVNEVPAVIVAEDGKIIDRWDSKIPVDQLMSLLEQHTGGLNVGQ